MDSVTRLSLYFNTVRYLKFTQIAWYAYRRFIQSKRTAICLSDHCITIRPNIAIGSTLGHVLADTPFGIFKFLNVNQTFDLKCLDWRAVNQSKLWRYNLHYFDFLSQTRWSLQQRLSLIQHWIQNNPVGVEDAWEPYTVSLRVVNWIKFILSFRLHQKIDETVLISLYRQILWLDKNIEYHILANHYFKNAVALFFGGVFFSGKIADRWLLKAKRILTQQISEQFCADGGHFESSPMYHVIMLMDCLDVLNLCQHSDGIAEQKWIDTLQAVAEKALTFLCDITFPDGDIPLFNDSALAIVPKTADVLTYAKTVLNKSTFGCSFDACGHAVKLLRYPQTGYYGLRKANDMLIVDCGPMGPAYQPGHAHCDLLSYELVLDAQRVIVDSGVYDYECSQNRAYARSTVAHNTVRVDQREQSEIWGGFRLARRAKPITACLSKYTNRVLFEGAHDAYRALGIVHRRYIEYDGASIWCVTDVLEGKGKHSAESFIHIHPNYHLKRLHNQNQVLVLNRNKQTIAKIKCDLNVSIEINCGDYFPQFGVKQANHVLCLQKTSVLPLVISYQIIKAS